MKHKQSLTLLALALALGFGTFAVLRTYANDPDTAEACNADALLALQEQLTAGNTNIALTGKVCPASSLKINHNVTLDLNGHDIVSDAASIRVIDIDQGNVTIKGTGSIIATDAKGIPVRVYGSTDPTATNFTNVTIGSGVNLLGGSDAYGLFVSFKESNYQAYGVTVNLEQGSIVTGGNGLYINGMIQHENGPTFNLADGVKVGAAKDGVTIYAAGYGTWNINAAELTGGTVLGLKSGVVNLKNTVMHATGDKVENVPNSDGINANGSTIQIEQNSAYAGGVDLTIDGGKYSSDRSAVFSTYNANPDARALGDNFKVQIKGGTFTSADGVEVFDGAFTSDNTKISGGSFTSDVKDLLIAGLTQDASGKVISSSSTVTPTPDDDKKPSTPDKDESGKTPDTGVNRASEISAVFTIGGLGVGIALIAIAALFAAVRRGDISVEIVREPDQPRRKSTARTSTSKRKPASAASKKASSSRSKASVASKRPTTRKTAKTASKSPRKAKKA